MLVKEYRICMPLSVDEYKIGQLYMIAKHSAEESHGGEGVEVISNEPFEDPVHGKGQFTEKRIHLSSRLPSWLKSFVPRIFYVTEKAWNYYPFTMTEYTCSFVPRFSISIQTKFENNKGTTDNVLNLTEDELKERIVEHVDILKDEVAPHHYKENEDMSKFKSVKTGRGPLEEDWKETSDPIMCSYKNVSVRLDVWGLQSRVEAYVHSAIREILLVGHIQAVAWVDDWFGMTIDDVREYEKKMQEETNEKLQQELNQNKSPTPTPPSSGDITPTSPAAKKGWFNWSSSS